METAQASQQKTPALNRKPQLSTENPGSQQKTLALNMLNQQKTPALNRKLRLSTENPGSQQKTRVLR